MKVWLGDTAERHTPAPSGRFRIFLIWGQSNIQGWGGTVSNLGETEWSQTADPLPGCFIFDKFGRNNRYLPDLVDADRGGEAHEFKPLTVGWVDGLYQWETLDADPGVGMECQFAHTVRSVTGDTILLVKMAKGGTQVTDQPFPTWNVAKTGADSYLRTMMDAYYAPAKAAAIAMAGGDVSKVVFGGLIQMIGATDARDPEYLAYPTDYAACTDQIRGEINTVDADQVPTLILHTPRAQDANGNVVGFIDENRAAQKAIATARANVETRDTTDCIDTDDIHFTGRGNSHLGQIAARWAVEQTPMAVTA